MGLDFEKRIRDPVHGDIELTSEEIEIVDTEQFQRLRGIRQLGPAYLVYPAATHTRFEHALGTLYMAQKIINGVNANSLRNRNEKVVSETGERIIRMAALLHDVTHEPFGHSIEDTLGLRERHDTKSRFKAALSGTSEVGRLLADSGILDQVVHVLSAKEEIEVDALRTMPGTPRIFPYMSDIINNTICADLLDYVRRDTQSTGIAFAFDDRIFDFFEVDPTSLRLALRIEHKGRYRTAVMSEILNILRARYTLAERLIFHHANQSVTSMLGRALQDCRGLLAVLDGPHSDFEYLREIESRGKAVARELVRRIRKRDLHKQIFVVSREEATAKRGLDTLVKRFRDPNQRLKFEQEVERQFKIRRGSFILHCPPGDMSLKEANVRVIRRTGELQILSSVEDDPPKGEVEELRRKYESLWSLQGFLASDHLYLEKTISGWLEQELRLHNELHTRQEALWEALGVLEEAFGEYRNKSRIGPKELKALKARTYQSIKREIQGALMGGRTLTRAHMIRILAKSGTASQSNKRTRRR